MPRFIRTERLAQVLLAASFSRGALSQRDTQPTSACLGVDCRSVRALSLSTCAGAASKFGERSACGDSDDDDKNNPRTAATCASAACVGFIASVTDDALQDMLTGFAACTGPLAGHQVYGPDGMYGPDYLGSVVRSTASECGLASALSGRRMALKAVQPAGTTTFRPNRAHPTARAAVKPIRLTSNARRLRSAEGNTPICVNGWVWPPAAAPPLPPLPVVTTIVHAEGDVSNYPPSKLTEMEQSVANEVDVDVEAVSITVAAGSVILTVYPLPQDPYPPP